MTLMSFGSFTDFVLIIYWKDLALFLQESGKNFKHLKKFSYFLQILQTIEISHLVWRVFVIFWKPHFLSKKTKR